MTGSGGSESRAGRGGGPGGPIPYGGGGGEGGSNTEHGTIYIYISIFVCLVSGKQLGPQKSKKEKRGANCEKK